MRLREAPGERAESFGEKPKPLTASARWCVNAEGLKLAANMNFRFPQFAPTSISSLIPHASPEAVDMINALIAWDPNKRPTAVQCLQMPYFQVRRIHVCRRGAAPPCGCDLTLGRRRDRALSGLCSATQLNEQSTRNVRFDSFKGDGHRESPISLSLV